MWRNQPAEDYFGFITTEFMLFSQKIITEAHAGKVIGLGNDCGHDINVRI